MAAPIRTGLNPVLLAVRNRLASKGAVPDVSRVLVVARRKKIPHFAAVQDVLLRPGGFRCEGPWADADGRVLLPVRRQLLVTPRTRMELDQADQDMDLLTDAALGHFTFEEKVADVLHDYQPEDANGNVLTFEPIRLLQGDEAAKEDEKSQSWGYATLVFEAAYMLQLNQADQ